MMNLRSFHLAFEIRFDHGNHHNLNNFFKKEFYCFSVIIVMYQGVNLNNPGVFKITINNPPLLIAIYPVH